MVDLVHAKREQILRVARRHGVTGTRVFAWFPGGLVADLEELLGRRVQIITERGLDELLRDHVLEEAIAL